MQALLPVFKSALAIRHVFACMIGVSIAACTDPTMTCRSQQWFSPQHDWFYHCNMLLEQVCGALTRCSESPFPIYYIEQVEFALALHSQVCMLQIYRSPSTAIL